MKDINEDTNSQKKVVFFKISKRSFFISLLFMSEDLFYENTLIIQNTLSIKIKIVILVNIYIIRFGFIDEKFTEIVDKRLEIQPQRLIKSKLV